MRFLNQYSMLWSSLIILAVAAFLLLRRGVNRMRVLGIIGISALLLAGWIFLRPDPANTTDLAQFQAEIGGGQTVLLELQSPY